MVAFPESTTRRPQYGYDNTPEEKVRRPAPDAGNSYHRDLWGVLRFRAAMDFLVSEADAHILWNFYLANRFNGWSLFDFETAQMDLWQIAIGDGATTTFSVKSKLQSFPLVRVNGVVQASGANFAVSVGTGLDGQDQLIFTAAPAAGHVIDISALVRRMYTVEFIERPTRRTIGHKRILISMRVQERFPLAA